MSTPLFLPTPSPEGLEKFRALYLARFGKHLTDGQARDLATRYLLIYSLGTSRVDKHRSLPTMEKPKP